MFRPSDAYHTCYVLAGLSSAQHKWELYTPNTTTTSTSTSTAGEATASIDEPSLLTSWSVSPYLGEVQIFDEQDRIVPLHPVYAIPAKCAADIKKHFAARQGF